MIRTDAGTLYEGRGSRAPTRWLFKARTTVPKPIFRCSAIALTLQPRWRSWTASSRSKTFFGPADWPSGFGTVFPSVFQACHHSLSDHGSLQLGHSRDNREHRFSHGCARIERLLVANEFDPQCAKLFPTPSLTASHCGRIDQSATPPLLQTFHAEHPPLESLALVVIP